MAVRETLYDKSSINNAGDVVGDRDVSPGDFIDLGTLRRTAILVSPDGQIVRSISLPPVRRRLYVLEPHPETGKDRMSLLPDGVVYTGDEIDLMFRVRRPGVTDIRVRSTPNDVSSEKAPRIVSAAT